MTQRVVTVCTTACILMGLLIAGPARAAEPGTNGDALASFQAFLTGGQALLDGTPEAPGAPSRSGNTLRPFEPWDGRHVCESDWLLLAIEWLDGNLPDFEPRTVHEILASLDDVTMAMSLDGSSLTTTRTATKPVLPSLEGADDVFGFQEGAILAPGTLDVGLHTFQAVIGDPVFGPQDFIITFTVDAAGTGVCVD